MTGLFDTALGRIIGHPGPLAALVGPAGLVHCLDAKTGKVHWTHDMLARVWGSPLVVEGKIYLGDEDGDLVVLELATKLKLLATNDMGNSVYSAPVVADDVLHISTRDHLIAIKAEDR